MLVGGEDAHTAQSGAKGVVLPGTSADLVLVAKVDAPYAYLKVVDDLLHKLGCEPCVLVGSTIFLLLLHLLEELVVGELVLLGYFCLFFTLFFRILLKYNISNEYYLISECDLIIEYSLNMVIVIVYE